MKTLQRTIFLFFLTLFSTFSLNAFAQESIVIGVNEIPPYMSQEFKDHGFLGKLITESFAMAGIDVEYKFQPAKRSVKQVELGSLDGIVGGYGTPEFRKKFHVSDSIVIDTVSFFYLISSEFDWNTLEDLKDDLIGGTLGYDYGSAFQQAEKSGLINVQRTGKHAQNFRKLLKKRIQAFPMSTLPGYVTLYKSLKLQEINQITNHSKPVHSTHLYLVMSKANEQNVKRIELFNQSFQRLKETGKYNQYFDETLNFFRETYVIEKN